VTAQRGTWINVDGSSNGTSALNARLAQGGFGADDGSGGLGVRNGVFYDGQGNVVTGNTDTGTMSYSVRACQMMLYLLGTTASGVVLAVNDATFKATTTAAPGSNSRIDVIWARHHAVAADGGSDSDNVFQIGVTQGTAAASPSVPSIPTGAMALAQATVPSGTTSTNALTITQVHNWTTSHGSPIPVRNSTERGALTPFNGMSVYRIDNHVTETHNGTAWITPSAVRYDGVAAGVNVGTSTVLITNWSTLTYAVGDIGYSAGVFTVATAGVYRWDATVNWPASASTSYRVQQYAVINGTPSSAGSETMNFAAGYGQQTITSGFDVQLSASDTLQVGLIGSTGGITPVSGVAVTMRRVS
jgi:hypothetical protein